MKINSLAFQTDLFFHRFTGVVLEYEEYLVIKTPTNPTYFWGNLLYFPRPPTTESLAIWKNIFREQFHSMNVEHMTFAWDSLKGVEGSAELFVQDGFVLEKSIVMVAREIKIPPKLNKELVVRPILSDDDWNCVLENHVLCRAAHFDEAPYRKFAQKRIDNYRLMIKAKKGFWMGAFFNGALVGELGIFSENGLGRFQTVGTHPDYRRIGVCSTLLYQALVFAEENMGISQFVMVADPEYHAAKIYESVGFIASEYQIGMCKFNKEIWAI
jgi:ribosomal protein S18 acetylase RimI-like enzyme